MCPLHNRNAHEIKRIFAGLYDYLVTRGLRPRLYTLDNEASTILKAFLTAENVECELVPPHIHQRNSTECAIRIFKNHFIAGLATTDPNFPLSKWCRLLPKQNSPSSYFASPSSTPNSLPMHNFKEYLTSTRPILHHQAPMSSYMKSLHNAEHGHPMVSTAGMLVLPLTTTNATAFGSPEHNPNALLTPSSSFQQSYEPLHSPIKMPQSELRKTTAMP